MVIQNKINILSAFILVYFTIGCNRKEKVQIVQFHNFSIELPNSWKKIDMNGIDSRVEIIITDNQDSIYVDSGLYSQQFNETKKIFHNDDILKYKQMKMNIKNLVYSESPEIDQAQGTFLNEYYYYDTIDHHIAKLKIPKKEGHGQIGIYFNNINHEKLTLSSKNMSCIEQEMLLKAFKSITFKK